MKEDLDYHPDSGAVDTADVMKDTNKPQTEQSTGDTGSTTFDPLEAPNWKKRRFKELRKRHHEHWNKDGEGEMNDTNIAYDTRTVCNQLELTDHQQRRVLKLVDEHRTQGLQYELTILGAVTYVLNVEGRWIQRDHDEYGDDCHETYAQILESYGFEQSQVADVAERIRKEQRSTV